MRVLFIGGTGPVGLAALPHLTAAGHDVTVAHTGVHEPDRARDVEHLHGERDVLLAAGGPAERWRPDAIVDTFAGGATVAKARQLGELAGRAGAGRIVAVSSIDVYRHCADAGVDGNPPAELARDRLPLSEDSARRDGPSPGSGAAHDNVAMEDALPDDRPVTILRPGAIYGPFDHPHVLREWYLVGRVARGERLLQLPDGGTQLFHRVAIDRVGRAVAAALERAPDGLWACNVADPTDFTYGALARLVAERLDWEWELKPVAWNQSDHPWNARQPVFTDTTRLRETLGVTAPDPVAATLAQLDWLWANRESVARQSA